jgi:predicted RNA-binding Zn ribbon-like protein
MPHTFTLIGGHPALDFVNTVHDWTIPEPWDYLGTVADAARFGEAAGLLTRAEAASLSRPELSRLRRLRAVLERVFRSTASPADLGMLNAELVEVARASRLVAAPLRREIAAEKAGAALLRLRLLDAAATLLVSDAMTRVKSCPACGWFFLDVSKNHSRRWCSMDTCGSAAKARRYYRRSRR